mmetsp:Transcript_25669/g.62890  ORF Transcript_25669/g.62890 Transcript_25669/m.62890 type:complete len:388 (-) Transcript_25669:622-1785(-)
MKVRHETRLFAHLAEPSPPKIINFLGVFHKGLVGKVVESLVPSGDQQSDFPRLLGQCADTQALAPKLADRTTAQGHETGKEPSHDISHMSFLLLTSHSEFVNMNFIVHHFFPFCRRINGVTATECVTAGTLVLIFSRILKGHLFESSRRRGIVQVIFLSTGSYQVVTSAHAAATTKNAQENQKGKKDGQADILCHVSIVTIVIPIHGLVEATISIVFSIRKTIPFVLEECNGRLPERFVHIPQLEDTLDGMTLLEDSAIWQNLQHAVISIIIIIVVIATITAIIIVAIVIITLVKVPPLVAAAATIVVIVYSILVICISSVIIISSKPVSVLIIINLSLFVLVLPFPSIVRLYKDIISIVPVLCHWRSISSTKTPNDKGDANESKCQ